MSNVPKMAAQSDSDARAMAALGGGPTDPDPKETAKQAAESVAEQATDELTKAEGMQPPTKAGPSGQDKADGSQMTPGPVLNKGKKKKNKDDDEDEDEMERSLPDDDDLIKTLDEALETARGASSDPDLDRRAELAEKLAKGETTPEELQELQNLIKSELPSDTDEDLDKSFTEAALSDPDIQGDIKTTVDGQEYDVSGFLARHAAFVGGALDSIRSETKETLTKGFTDTSRFNLALAKANRALGQRVVEQGELIKSLTGRLETVEETPVPHRAIQGAAQLTKSLPQTADGQVLPSRAEVINGLTQLNKSAGDDGKAPCGHDITEAVVRFESTGQIHPQMMADVKKAIGHKE